MSIYDETKVEILLGDHWCILNAANCRKLVAEECEALKKKHAELLKECETQAREINNLRCELSTRPPRELQPITKTAIKNAKEVLNACYRPITSEIDAANETVPGDRFQSVYKALRDLVFRLEQEKLP